MDRSTNGNNLNQGNVADQGAIFFLFDQQILILNPNLDILIAIFIDARRPLGRNQTSQWDEVIAAVTAFTVDIEACAIDLKRGLPY